MTGTGRPTGAPPDEAQRIAFVTEAEAGQRLDVAVARHLPGLSRAAIQRLIDEAHVRVNGGLARPGLKLRPGDRVTAVIPPPRHAEPQPEPIPLDVLFEDDQILVLNKPKGLVVHPAPGTPTGTLVNAVLAHAGEDLPVIGGEERPGIVHRLDKDTSGVMVVAKTDAALHDLQRQIAERAAQRSYLAVVRGAPKFERAEVDAPIGRHPADRQRMAVLPASSRHAARPAVTHLRTLERFPGFALLQARLETGRTHQIRVHCSYIGHPVVGDPVYGPASRRGSAARAYTDPTVTPEIRAAIEALQGQALHAYRLAFTHPTTGAPLCLTAPPPADIRRLLQSLGSRYAESVPEE
jgi:23S rRNA pseudouridine1911/1915/1917 synthase